MKGIGVWGLVALLSVFSACCPGPESPRQRLMRQVQSHLQQNFSQQVQTKDLRLLGYKKMQGYVQGVRQPTTYKVRLKASITDAITGQVKRREFQVWVDSTLAVNEVILPEPELTPEMLQQLNNQ